MCTGANDIFTGTTAVPARVILGAGRTQSDRPLSQLPPDLSVLGNPGFCGEFFGITVKHWPTAPPQRYHLLPNKERAAMNCDGTKPLQLREGRC